MPPDPEKWASENSSEPSVQAKMSRPSVPIQFPSIDGWQERIWTQTFIAFLQRGATANAAALNADFAVKAFAKQNWK